MELKKSLNVIVFWGAAWGIVEATLGSLLHAVNFNIGWLFWFPIAFYFMNKVYRQTGKYESVILSAAIAAAIKLVDLALPIRIDKVINPAASIILEGLAVFIAFRALEKRNDLIKYKIVEAAAASFSWRILYAAYVLFLPSWMAAISPVRGLAPFLKFFLFEGTANALVIFMIIELSERINKLYKAGKVYSEQPLKKSQYTGFLNRIGYMPLPAFSMLIAAVFIQRVL